MLLARLSRTQRLTAPRLATPACCSTPSLAHFTPLPTPDSRHFSSRSRSRSRRGGNRKRQSSSPSRRSPSSTTKHGLGGLGRFGEDDDELVLYRHFVPWRTRGLTIGIAGMSVGWAMYWYNMMTIEELDVSLGLGFGGVAMTAALAFISRVHTRRSVAELKLTHEHGRQVVRVGHHSGWWGQVQYTTVDLSAIRMAPAQKHKEYYLLQLDGQKTYHILDRRGKFADPDVVASLLGFRVEGKDGASAGKDGAR